MWNTQELEADLQLANWIKAERDRERQMASTASTQSLSRSEIAAMAARFEREQRGYVSPTPQSQEVVYNHERQPHLSQADRMEMAQANTEANAMMRDALEETAIALPPYEELTEDERLFRAMTPQELREHQAVERSRNRPKGYRDFVIEELFRSHPNNRFAFMMTPSQAVEQRAMRNFVGAIRQAQLNSQSGTNQSTMDRTQTVRPLSFTPSQMQQTLFDREVRRTDPTRRRRAMVHTPRNALGPGYTLPSFTASPSLRPALRRQPRVQTGVQEDPIYID